MSALENLDHHSMKFISRVDNFNTNNEILVIKLSLDNAKIFISTEANDLPSPATAGTAALHMHSVSQDTFLDPGSDYM